MKPVVEALKKHGHVKRGFLGVNTQPVRLANEIAEKLKQETGLMVIGAESDGPAAKAGMMQGDVLVALGDKVLTHIGDLQAALGTQRGGQIHQSEIDS